MEDIKSKIKIKLALVIGLFSFGICLAQELEFTNLFPQKKGVACYRIPSIATAPNGDLITAIDERIPSCADLRDNNDINIVSRRSSDNGKSWTPTIHLRWFFSAERTITRTRHKSHLRLSGS